MMITPSPFSAAQLIEWIEDSRRRTLALVNDLTGEQLRGPRLAIVNPPLWEIGHLAWFHEKWVLRHLGGRPSLRADADALYDSAAVPHATRWDLPLPSWDETLAYLDAVRRAILDRLGGPLTAELAYFVLLGVFHEDMHGEAFAYTRQTLEYARPRLGGTPPNDEPGGPLPGDVLIPGGSFQLGATPDEPFVFDNEKWAHEVKLQPFAIARAPVTQAEFAAFVEDNGYSRSDLWTSEGWTWREQAEARRPVYWRRESSGWLRRDYDRWVPLEPHRPVLHVNWYEADAYCRWAGRRLPTEAEWERAAATTGKRRFPWGDEPPSRPQANLGATRTGCLDVGSLPAGDSAEGCRQLIGNVWEWTADAFGPYPGFVPDPYKEYSQPWFGDHRVLRGGCWVTQPRLLRNTWRNFYTPDRRDVWCGFRTASGGR